MKNSVSLLPVLLFTLTVPVAAQDQGPPQPAKELQKLNPLLGHWQGEGVVYPGPGIPELKWTASTWCRKALGGHFLREEAHIKMHSEDTPAPLLFKSFHGYDKHKKRHMSYSLSNQGAVQVAEVTFLDDNTILSMGITFENGERFIERWTTKFKKDSYDVVGERAGGQGEFAVHVKGSFRRVGGKPKAKIMEASMAFMGEADPRMSKLKPFEGRYRFKGEMFVAPGAPMQPISGVYTSQMIYAGTALESTCKGDPAEGMPAYEAWGCMCWDAREQCYRSLWFDNMGEASSETSWLTKDGNMLSHNQKRFYDGSPALFAGITTIKDGKLVSHKTHGTIGTSKPMKVFEISYTKQK